MLCFKISRNNFKNNDIVFSLATFRIIAIKIEQDVNKIPPWETNSSKSNWTTYNRARDENVIFFLRFEGPFQSFH